MTQQLIAIAVLLFFVFRLFWQRKQKKISNNEFVFWIVFWLLAFLAIIFIKQIDTFVGALGFSASGIDVLIYFGVAILFYLIFRMRLKMEKMDKNITKIVRENALNNSKINEE